MTTIFKGPTLEYKISFGLDHTLQWDPPTNSKELAIALSYHFPLEPDLESKMRAAMVKFLQMEKSEAVHQENINRYLTPEDDSPPSSKAGSHVTNSVKRIKPNKEVSLKVLSWNPEKGARGGFKREVKRRRYDAEEGAKVAKNRGSACEEHRRQKLKCDPEICPRNKQRLKNDTFISSGQAHRGGPCPRTTLTSTTSTEIPHIAREDVPPLKIADDQEIHMQSKSPTEWSIHSTVMLNEEMSSAELTYPGLWEPNVRSNVQHIDTQLPSSILNHYDDAVLNMMPLDPNFNWDYPMGEYMNMNSFSWQGSSDFDPGIFFLPTLRHLDPSTLPYISEDTVYPDIPEGPKLKSSKQNAPLLPTGFDSFHTFVLPSNYAQTPDIPVEADVSADVVTLPPRETPESGTGVEIASTEATFWTYAEGTSNDEQMSGITISIGQGDNSISIDFENKANLLAKLRDLMTDPNYSFVFSGCKPDMEERVSYCRASLGRKSAWKRLKEIPYCQVRR